MIEGLEFDRWNSNYSSVSSLSSNWNNTYTTYSQTSAFYDIPTVTGIVSGGLLSVNTDNTKFNISAGTGYVVDYWTDPTNPLVTKVTWNAFTGVTDTYLTESVSTTILINSSGTVLQQTSSPSDEDYKQYLVIGKTLHGNLSSINAASQYQSQASGKIGWAGDISRFIGVMAIGTTITPNDANLSIKLSSGKLYRVGANYTNNQKNPNIATINAASPKTFQYRYKNGLTYTVTSPTTAINPNTYNLVSGGSGSLVTTGFNNKYTIQRVYVFPSGNTYVTYGQQTYNSLAAAVAGIQTETPDVDPQFADSCLRAFICVKQGCIDLSNTAEASFEQVGKFGESQLAIAGTSGAGNVVGPSSSVNDSIARFDGTTGTVIKDNTNSTLDDNGNLTLAGSISTANTGTSQEWYSTYTTVYSNSATTWNYQGSDIKPLTANWQSTYTTFSQTSANPSVTTLTVSNSASIQTLKVLGDTTIVGNLSTLGTTTFIDTTVTVTSAMSITNTGTGPALQVTQTGDQPVAVFYDDANPALYIDGTDAYPGYIGVNTNSPTRRFHQEGGKFLVNSDSGGYGQFQLTNPTGGEVSVVFASDATPQTDGTITSTDNSYIWAFGLGSYGNSANKFIIGNNQVANSVFTIQADGNVGIGTTSPNEKLTVVGNISSTGSLAVNSAEQTSGIQINVKGDGSLGVIRVDSGDGSGDAFEAYAASGLAVGFQAYNRGTTNTVDFRGVSKEFYLLNGPDAGSLAESFRITSGGNVGIGTSTPAMKFSVNDQSSGDGFIARFERPNTVDGEFTGILLGGGAYREGFIYYIDNTTAANRNFGFGIGGDSTASVSFYQGGKLVIGDGGNYAPTNYNGTAFEINGNSGSQSTTFIDNNGNATFVGTVSANTVNIKDVEFTGNTTTATNSVTATNNFIEVVVGGVTKYIRLFDIA